MSIGGKRRLKCDSWVGDDRGQVDGLDVDCRPDVSSTVDLLGYPKSHSLSLATVQLEEVIFHTCPDVL